MGARIPELADRSWLVSRYIDAGKTIREIADELRCAGSVVWLALRRHGVTLRPAHRRPAIVEPGLRVGLLTVTGPAPSVQNGSGKRQAMSFCRCDCGATGVAVRNDKLRAGIRSSCGCLARSSLLREVGEQNRVTVRDAARRLGRFTVSDLAEATGINRRTVLDHLKAWEESGTVNPPVYEWAFAKPNETAPPRPTSEPRASKPKNYSGAGPAGNADLPADKDMRRLAQQAIAAGAKVRRSGSDHFRVAYNGGREVTISNTPSSSRAVANARADLRGLGLKV